MEQFVVADSDLETSRAPAGTKTAEEGDVSLASVNSIGVISFAFDFRKKNATGQPSPGSSHEDRRVVNIPAGSGFFITISSLSWSYVQDNLSSLRERPLGQAMISLGMQGNNLVCRVRLTDSNADDPISIFVRGTLVTFR